MVGLMNDSDYSKSLTFPLTRQQSHERTANVRACVALVLVTVFERCAYYSITFNLAFTLSRWYRPGHNPSQGDNLVTCLKGDHTPQQMEKKAENYNHLDTIQVAIMLTVFYLLCSLFSIVGGWLGDAKLGRFRTIRISFWLYLLGTTSFGLLVLVCICNYDNKGVVCALCPTKIPPEIQYPLQGVLLGLSFLFLALGYGLYKPNIAPFGADQMREHGAEAMEKFYLWFYLFTNCGAFCAYCISFLQSPHVANYYPYKYLLSCFAPVPCIIICIVVYTIGTRYYIKSEPSMDAFKTFFMILKELMAHMKIKKEVLMQVGGSRLALLKRHNGGQFSAEEVEAFKELWRIVPVTLTLLCYWIVYSQNLSMYYIQGFYLDRPDWMPLSVVQLFNPILILFLVPMLKNVLYPYLTRKGYHLSAITRIMIGYALISLSLCAAVFVAVYTRIGVDPHMNPKGEDYFANDNTTHYMTYRADLSIFITSPQIILVTLSEVFTIIAGMEFVYTEAPRRMKSFAMGLFCAVNAIGDFLAILLILIIKLLQGKYQGYFPWICNTLTNGRLENFYMLLTFFMVINMLVLWKCANKFRSGNIFR